MRRRLWRALPPVALTLVAIIAGTGSATQVVQQTPEEMGRAADLVVRGRVDAVRCYWNEAHTRILTEVDVAIDQQIKGRVERSVRVVQMGGVVDGMRMTVSGALEWRPGEEVLLFLERSLPDRYRVAGFSQGKFTIERDPATGVEYARPAGLAGIELVGAAARATARQPRLRLEALLDRIAPASEGGR
jgi:hypothetical protein